MKRMSRLTRVLVVALAVGLPGLALARSLITTLAGCKSEFGSGGQYKACEKCIKGNGKFALHPKNKGAWVCE